MSRQESKGVEDARSQLPALLAAAERGHSTVITRHGRAVAAIVPVDRAPARPRQLSFLGLAGSGKGLWGRDRPITLRKLRDEWDR
jgi:prevent-host-death family protein